MTYHKRQKGQSKEIFRMIGGTHTRPGVGSAGRIRIVRGDTCHITQKEVDFFGDKFELVKAEKATDVDITTDDGDDETTEGGSTDDPTPDGTAADDVDVSAATGDGPLTRQDFSSVQAHTAWEKAGSPDLSKVTKRGHSGRTYSLADVKSIL